MNTHIIGVSLLPRLFCAFECIVLYILLFKGKTVHLSPIDWFWHFCIDFICWGKYHYILAHILSGRVNHYLVIIWSLTCEKVIHKHFVLVFNKINKYVFSWTLFPSFLFVPSERFCFAHSPAHWAALQLINCGTQCTVSRCKCLCTYRERDSLKIKGKNWEFFPFNCSKPK